ncbi:MAG TPA: hypothetical protein VLT33_02465 [Labilithrix sp.]|nr:hypothetical protein [Labilithrix sp.]
MDIPDPTIVCGRGTGRSGMATAGADASVALGLGLEDATAGAAEAADSAAFAPPPSCLLSQATEASKITDATQASERMRVD